MEWFVFAATGKLRGCLSRKAVAEQVSRGKQNRGVWPPSTSHCHAAVSVRGDGDFELRMSLVAARIDLSGSKIEGESDISGGAVRGWWPILTNDYTDNSSSAI